MNESVSPSAKTSSKRFAWVQPLIPQGEEELPGLPDGIFAAWRF